MIISDHNYKIAWGKIVDNLNPGDRYWLIYQNILTGFEEKYLYMIIDERSGLGIKKWAFYDHFNLKRSHLLTFYSFIYQI